MAEFVKVANLSELEAGSCKAVEAGRKTIALVNGRGTIYALDDTCLHRGGPLGEGILEGSVVTCPWHMWEYNVCTGEKIDSPDIKVASYPVQVDGNDVKVAL